MDKDRIEGSIKQGVGAVKEGFGKLTGDTKTEAEGAAEKDRWQGAECRRWCEGYRSRRHQLISMRGVVRHPPLFYQSAL